MKQYIKVHILVYEGVENKLKFFLKLNSRINRLCKEHPGISIIHFNDALLAASSLPHRGYGHLKRTMTAHGLDIVFPFFIYTRFVLPRFNNFDLIIAVSEATRNACVKRNIRKDRIIVIQNGVDTETKIPASRHEIDLSLQKNHLIDSRGKRILVAVGRPVKRKGFSWFIRHVVPVLHEDFLLLLIGPGRDVSRKDQLFRILPNLLRKRLELFLGYPSDAVEIRNLLNDPFIGSRVKHLGKLPAQIMADIISVSDAYIMPNIPVKGDMEGFGLVCLEAAMCGTQVFASGIEGITDAIHHEKNGFLLPPANAKAWVKALNQLRSDASDLSLSPDGIITFTQQTFSWDRMTRRYLEAFGKLTD